MTLSGARDLRFDASSHFTARLSFLLKHATFGNQTMREIENEVAAQKIKQKTVFEPKIGDPLDDVIKIIDLPDAEYKKTMFPYVKPTVETANKIDTKQEIIDTDFINLQNEFNKVNDVATEQKKKKRKSKILLRVIVDNKNLFSTFDDFWWEDDMFNDRDSIATVDASKNILNNISDNILNNLRPVNNRTEQEVADDQNIPIDDRTQQELKDNDYISFESDTEEIDIEEINILNNLQNVENRTEQEVADDQNILIDDRTQQELKDDDYISFEINAEESNVEEIDTTLAWDQNKTSIGRPGLMIKLSTDYNTKIKAANKIKNKYFKKNIGQRNKKNNVLTKWLKTAGYLDTKDQDKLNYILVRPKNKTPKSDGVLLTTEIDSTDFKKENLTTKIKKNKFKKPFVLKEKKETPDETIQLLDKIATLDPGKNAQIAAKKISEKYKKLREANARKKK